MTAPVRLRLSRQRGFNLQAHSAAINGLVAVNVARPFRWGNPWKIGSNLFDPGCAPEVGQPSGWRTVKTPADAVLGFRRSVDWDPDAPWRVGELICIGGYGRANRNRKTIREELAGKNLACWCALDQPCHADVLLALAASRTCEAV